MPRPFALTRLLTAAIFVAAIPVGLRSGAQAFAQSPIPSNGVGKVGVGYGFSSGDSSYVLTIRKFAFVATRINVNGLASFPDADKKFLVIDFAVQNAGRTRGETLSGTTFTMTAIDASGQKYDVESNVENTTSNQPLETSLQPGQRVECRAYIIVPATSQVPKLLLSSGGSKVIRYDLRNAVAPVERIVADPADKTGSRSLAIIADARIGATYPTGPFDLALEKVEFSDLPIHGVAPDVGTRFLVVTFRAKNALTPAGGDADVRNAGAASYSVLTADRQRINWTGDYYNASTDEVAKTTIPPGFEKHFRLCFQVPRTGKLTSFTISEGERYRRLIYNLRAVR